MGRPPEVSDDEIIAAGLRLQADVPVNATRIWAACGRHGKPVRLFEVWNTWLLAQAADAAAGAVAPPIPIPEMAQRLADGLKTQLLTGIDRALGAIYQGIDEAVKGRYQAELSSLVAVREEHAREMQDALAALGEMSDAQDERDGRIHDMEGALTSTLRQRDVSEAMRGAVVEQQSAMANRLQAVEGLLERERSISFDLKIANARAEGEMRALTRQLSDMQAAFDAYRESRENGGAGRSTPGDVSAHGAEVTTAADASIGEPAENATLPAASSVAMRAHRSRGKARPDARAPLLVHSDEAQQDVGLPSLTYGIDDNSAALSGSL